MFFVVKEIKKISFSIQQMASSNTTNEEDQLFGPLKSVLNQLVQQNKQYREEIDRLKQQNDEQRRKSEQIQVEMNDIRARHETLLEQLGQLTDLYRIYNHELYVQHREPVERVLVKKWKQHGTTIAGGNGQGNELNRLKYPYGLAIDETTRKISIADYGNCRIVEWDSNGREGRVVFDGHEETNQISCPRDVIIDQQMNSLIFTDWISRRVVRYSHQDQTCRNVISNTDCHGLAMDKDGSLYVSDWKKHEIRRWRRGEAESTVVAGGNEKGNQLNQLDQPTFIFVDDHYALYISDCGNHRVMKWMADAREGIIVAGGNNQGNHLNQLSHPQGIRVDRFGRVYIADQDNDRVIGWDKDAREGVLIVGSNGKGQADNQLNNPTGLAFDRQGNLYVVDQENHRIQHFEIDLS